MNFLARVIVGGIIAFTTMIILENSKKKFEEEAKRDKNKTKGSDTTTDADIASAAHTHYNYLFDFETFGAPSSKRKITKAMKEIMAKYEVRKVGRTGDPAGRLGNYSGKYDALYLLTKSKNLGVIKDLEAAYIDKFQGELDNTSPSILGANETTDGWYYLYVTVK